jgi:hypothetical protein
LLTIPLNKFCEIDNATFTEIDDEIFYDTNLKLYNLYIEIWIGSIPISQNVFHRCLADTRYNYNKSVFNGEYKNFCLSFETKDNPSIRGSFPDSLSYDIEVSTADNFAKFRPMCLECYIFIEKLDDIKRFFIIEEGNLIYRVVYEQTERNLNYLKKWINSGKYDCESL